MTRLFDPRDDGPKSGAATTITPRNYASSLPGVTGIGFSEHPQLDAGLWRSFGHRRARSGNRNPSSGLRGHTVI